MTYLLDSNVFIEAKNRYYAFDVCPGFWTWLDEAHDRGLVYSVQKVREELLGGADELADWVRERESFFLAPDDSVVQGIRTLAAWAMTANPAFEQAAVNTFLQVGDSFLVAQALAGDFIVVTHEVYAATVKRIKIPNACQGVGVDYVDAFEMLRREGARFG